MTWKILIVLIVSAYSIKAQLHDDSYEFYPYIGLIFSLVNGRNISEPCSGYIFTTRLIVTTANCYIGENTKSMVIIVGLLDVHSLIKIQKWILHPYYSPSTDQLHNEIAIVRTETEIPYKNVGSIHLIPEDSLVHDMNCIMVGWKIDELDFIGKDILNFEVQKTGEFLKNIYAIDKKIISSIQCKAQLNIIEKDQIILDDSFLCVKPDPNFNEDHNYGTLGAVLLCKEDSQLEYNLVGLKRKQRDIESRSPELFINLRNYNRYIGRILKDHDSKPVIYFCEIRVCGKKYYTYGEYCILGDNIGCLHINRKFVHYFPQSHANRKLLSYTLNLFALFITVFFSI